ncbi:MAG: hypothetical protein GOV02_02275, partial [Candidatus Aenigmarchaeota archaeon]|nr:hypothetical protein [Candidatus Aenigmarchaeota archaeon]
MVELSGKKTNLITENPGKAVAIGIGAVATFGTVLYNVVSGPEESVSGKAQVSIDGDFNIYTDVSNPGNATMHIGNGTTQYEISQSPEFYQSILDRLPNASREALGMADYFVDLQMVEGKDALVKFTPNGTGNESEAAQQSVYLPAADLEEVIREDIFNRYIKPDLDLTHGVDGWELVSSENESMSALDSVEVNYLPFDILNPIQHEEIEDVLGTSYSDRMVDILDVSMDKLYPVGNDTDNDTRAANEEARVEYQSLMDDAKEGNAKMRIT